MDFGQSLVLRRRLGCGKDFVLRSRRWFTQYGLVHAQYTWLGRDGKRPKLWRAGGFSSHVFSSHEGLLTLNWMTFWNQHTHESSSASGSKGSRPRPWVP